MVGVHDDLVISVNVIILACSLILRRRRALKGRRHRFWVRPSWFYRNTEGQVSALLPRRRARDEGYFRKCHQINTTSVTTQTTSNKCHGETHL